MCKRTSGSTNGLRTRSIVRATGGVCSACRPSSRSCSRICSSGARWASTKYSTPASSRPPTTSASLTRNVTTTVVLARPGDGVDDLHLVLDADLSALDRDGIFGLVHAHGHLVHGHVPARLVDGDHRSQLNPGEARELFGGAARVLDRLGPRLGEQGLGI